MLFQTCTKVTFGLSDVFVVTVIARNIINGVGSSFFRDRILRFGKNMPQSLKRFLSNFNVVAIQNSLDGFRNTLNVRNNSKTRIGILLIGNASFPDTAEIISSTYRFQKKGLTGEVAKAFCSTSSITMLAMTAETGKPIAVPKTCCRYIQIAWF